MNALELVWDGITVFFSSVTGGFEKTVTAVFGSSNARHVKRMNSRVEAINALEPNYESLSDQELAQHTTRFRERLANGETIEDILHEAFAVCREGGRRFLNMRHYDVQLVGGMVLNSGAIAEMVTGEGKTLVATLAAYLNALEGKGVHVVTVNDYLARRDMEWMAPLYMGLGLTVGTIQSNMPVPERQAAYSCDITYGTNNEFGFDYLRDNMRQASRGDNRFDARYQQSQGRLQYAIIDEVDNILIDEARTPLIISGSAHQNARKYPDADRIARKLKKDEHFKVNEKDHNVGLTDEGVREAERMAGVESFYTAGNMEWPHLLDNSLKAHYLYKCDVNYVVNDGRVIIVDEFTGRLMEGRQWSDGLHQAVEAKEGVSIKEETQTLATITLQNFFKLYNKLSGMTGTALTEATEFWKIYKLDVVAIPTNRAMKRQENADVIYCSEVEKFEAVAEEIERVNRWDVVVTKDSSELWGEIVRQDDNEIEFRERHENESPRSLKDRETKTYKRSELRAIELKGRPVLVGTVSIEKSERLSGLLIKRGIEHEVLNAKFHGREAEIVAQAGRMAAVTIATNMAGRGTDIVLGGNADTMAWARLQDKYPTRLEVPPAEWDELVDEIQTTENMKEMGKEIKVLGGLHVIGTERHDARRIDLQLRGRCGRQGDPGSSRFFLSLEDDLMRIFAGPWVKTVLERLGMKEGERIESKMVSRRIESAQKKVEEKNFESRKNLLEYDEVMDEQRKRVYTFRQRILDGVNCRDLVLDMIREEVERHLDVFLARDYSEESFAKYAGSRLATKLDGRDFRGMTFASADTFAREEADRHAQTAVQGAIDENLPEEDPDEWNWVALANFANHTWGLQLRDRDLKRTGFDGISEFLIENAEQAIAKVDLSGGEELLDPEYAIRTIVDFAGIKFGVEITEDELRDQEPEVIKELVLRRASVAYEKRECEYPVMAAMVRFSVSTSDGKRVDRDQLLDWAASRFDSDLSRDDIRGMQREQLAEFLVDLSGKSQGKADELCILAEAKVAEVFGAAGSNQTLRLVAGRAGEESLAVWVKEVLHADVKPSDLGELERDDLMARLVSKAEDVCRPEMRRVERALLLQIIDGAWKDHLLVMDRLRTSVGLAGYAQLDPKVEYKREGMRLFDDMWHSVNERVTDLIFRMEALDEDFIRSTEETMEAHHDDAGSLSGALREQQEGNESQGGEPAKMAPIRNQIGRVGRNDPCPCESGKKYKNCCMRRAVG
jgi:preprotein translocase subunit SecA